jgi:sporulation protein YlmC with PRC-barrel domain
MSHKDKIAGDIPPGLSDLLKSRDTAEEHVSTSAAAPSRIGDAYRAPRSSVGDAAHAASSSGAAPASGRWAYWALPAVAVGLLAWYFLGEERTPQPIAKGPLQSSLPTAQGSISDTDVQRRITAALDSLDGTLKGAKDTPLLALPQLQQTSGELDRLSEMANRLPVESRERIAEGIKAAIARLKTALDNVDATPGATGDVKPVVAALRAKLEALGRTPGSLAQQRPGLVVEREAFLARSPSGAFLMSGYVDRSVHNRLGERIGTVSDIVMAPDTTIAAALISVGSFLGIGDKEVAVPFAAIEVVRRDNDWLLVVDTTKEALRGAPTFEDTAARMRLPPRGSNPR